MGRQDRSKRAQDPLKTAQKPPKTLPRGPKSSQERPKTPSRRPKTPPGALLERSWRPSWDQPITRSKSRLPRVNLPKLLGSILASKMGSKTTPRRPQHESKIKTKHASLFYRSWTRLGPVLRRSWTRLGFNNNTKSIGKRKARATFLNPRWPQDRSKTGPRAIKK